MVVEQLVTRTSRDLATAVDSARGVQWWFKNEGLEETVPLGLISPPEGAPLLSAATSPAKNVRRAVAAYLRRSVGDSDVMVQLLVGQGFGAADEQVVALAAVDRVVAVAPVDAVASRAA